MRVSDTYKIGPPAPFHLFLLEWINTEKICDLKQASKRRQGHSLLKVAGNLFCTKPLYEEEHGNAGSFFKTGRVQEHFADS